MFQKLKFVDAPTINGGFLSINNTQYPLCSIPNHWRYIQSVLILFLTGSQASMQSPRVLFIKLCRAASNQYVSVASWFWVLPSLLTVRTIIHATGQRLIMLVTCIILSAKCFTYTRSSCVILAYSQNAHRFRVENAKNFEHLQSQWITRGSKDYLQGIIQLDRVIICIRQLTKSFYYYSLLSPMIF